MSSVLPASLIAIVVHEANRAYCAITGDPSQPVWGAAPLWQQKSAKEGVEALIADPSLTAEELHKKWCESKTRDGWTYGEVKDPEAKTHPCLVEYRYLPKEQQMKDHLFQAIVRVLAELPKGYVTV